MRLPIRFPLLSIVSWLLITGLAGAQDLDNLTITGRVIDQNGAVILGARVTATFVNTIAQRITITDDGGQYKLVQLEPGIYELKALANGFQTQVLTGLVFVAGRNAQIDFVLFPPTVTFDPVVVTTESRSPVDWRYPR